MNEYTFRRVAIEYVTVKAKSENEAYDKLMDGTIESKWFEEDDYAGFDLEGVHAPGGA